MGQLERGALELLFNSGSRMSGEAWHKRQAPGEVQVAIAELNGSMRKSMVVDRSDQSTAAGAGAGQRGHSQATLLRRLLESTRPAAG